MSHETTYSLSWDETSPTKEELAQALAENIDGSTPGQQDYEDVTSDWMEMLEGDRTETRWESHEKDMRKSPGCGLEPYSCCPCVESRVRAIRTTSWTGWSRQCRERSYSHHSNPNISGNQDRTEDNPSASAHCAGCQMTPEPSCQASREEDQERSNPQNTDLRAHIEVLLDAGMERTPVLPYGTLIA